MRAMSMSRIVAAAFLVSVLAGCVTSEGPYSRSAVSSLERERASHSVSRREKSAQTAHAAGFTGERTGVDRGAECASRRWLEPVNRSQCSGIPPDVPSGVGLASVARNVVLPTMN